MGGMKISTTIAACAIFSVLGFLGNWFKVELFFNVDFLFGSFFTMLDILVIGAAAEAAVGTVAGTCTYLLGKHPWATVIFAAQAIFVGALYSRRKGNVVVYDIVFWVCAGIPLILFFYHHVMGVELQSTVVIMLKQSVNGVFNALMATLAYVLYKSMKKGAGERIAFSQMLFVAMASLVILPSMYLAITGMRVYREKRTGSFKAQVSSASRAVRKTLAAWVGEQHKNIQILSTFYDVTLLSEKWRTHCFRI